MSLVVLDSTAEYRRAALTLTGKDDVVLECGCAQGVTSSLMAGKGRVRRVVGVDKGKPEIEEACRRYGTVPNLAFVQCDATDVASITKAMQLCGSGGDGSKVGGGDTKRSKKVFTKIFVDVSGVAGLSFLVPLLEMLEDAWHPDVMVVKSVRLGHLQGCMSNGTGIYQPEVVVPAASAAAAAGKLAAAPPGGKTNKRALATAAYRRSLECQSESTRTVTSSTTASSSSETISTTTITVSTGEGGDEAGAGAGAGAGPSVDGPLDAGATKLVKVCGQETAELVRGFVRTCLETPATEPVDPLFLPSSLSKESRGHVFNIVTRYFAQAGVVSHSAVDVDGGRCLCLRRGSDDGALENCQARRVQSLVGLTTEADLKQ